MREFKYGLAIPGAAIAVTLGLIFCEPDFGTTMLLATVCCILLFVAGANWKYIVPPMLAGAVAITLAIMNDPVRSNRIMAFLHPEQHREGVFSRPIKPCWLWVLAGRPVWDWVTAVRSWGSYRNITRTLSSP